MSVYSPLDAAGIAAAAAAAGPGDFVGIPAGTFDCRSAPLAWKPGAMVQGAGIGRTIIQGQVQSALAGNRYPLVLKGVTFDSTGLSPVGVGVNEFFDGQVILVGVKFTGGASGTLLRFNANTYPVVAKMSRCLVHDSAGDCISTSAASQTYGEQSKLNCYECKAYTAGGGANDQALTSHVYFPIDWFGGYLANAAADGQTVAQADEFCPIRIYGAKIVHGNNSAAVQCDTLLFCDLSSTTGDDEMVRVYNVAEANRFHQLRLGIHGAAGGLRWLVGNVFEDASINVEDVNGTWSGKTFIRGNLVQGRTSSESGGDVGIQVYSGYGPATVVIENNVVREHYRLVMVSAVGNPVVKFRNNLLYSKHASGKCIYFYTAGGGSITLNQYSGYNHLHGYDAADGYTLQTGDVTTKPTPAEVAAWESRLPRTTWDRSPIQEAMDALDRYRPEIEPTYLGPAIRNAVEGAKMDLVDAPNATAVAAIKTAMEAEGGTLHVIAEDVAGLDGAAMRGTDGAYTGTPPSASTISSQVQNDLASAHGAGSWEAGEGGGLTAQQIRDAMKLAPSEGSPAVGSVDALIAGIGTTAPVKVSIETEEITVN